MITMSLDEYCEKSGQKKETLKKRCQRGQINARKIDRKWHLFLVPAEIVTGEGNASDYDYEPEYCEDEGDASAVKEVIYSADDEASAMVEVPVRLAVTVSVKLQ